jgi:hypothetical protein
MELRPGLAAADDAVAAFAHRHGVGRLALYGSLGMAEMELELEALLGREVELRTYHDLSRHFRDRVLAESVSLYAA